MVDKYKVGDVVVLKSDSEGEVWMTVVGLGTNDSDDKDTIDCCWFDSNKEICSWRFPQEALLLVNLPE